MEGNFPIYGLAGGIGLCDDAIFSAMETTSAKGNSSVVKATLVDASTGETLPFANVIIEGSTTGVTSDLSGNFSLIANANDTIVISYLGYQTMQFSAGKIPTIIEMIPSVEQLSEVVVTANSAIPVKKNNTLRYVGYGILVLGIGYAIFRKKPVEAIV